MPHKIPYYDIILKIGKQNYSANVQSVTIVGSIHAVFQPIFIRMRIDSQDVVLKKIYGQEDTKITIRLMTENIQEKEEHEIKLYVLKVLGGYTQKPQNQQMHMLSNKITLVCIPKGPWEFMRTPVNYLAQDTSPKSPFEVAQDLVDKYLSGVKKEIDDKNANKYKPEQIPVPPMNFAAAIDFLEERYSIYKGLLFYQCRFEEDTLSMWDLSQKISDTEVYTVWNLAHGKKEEPEIYEKSGADDKTFYIYSNLVFKTHSGSIFGGENYTNRFILKPRDKLYKTIELTADDVDKKKLLPKDSGELIMHKDLKKNNIRYHGRSFVGVDEDESVLTSKLSKKFYKQTEGTFRLDRNLRTKNLFKVGIPIMLKAEVQNYQRVHGKYLVSGSKITYIRDVSAHFKAIADINIFRSDILSS